MLHATDTFNLNKIITLKNVDVVYKVRRGIIGKEINLYAVDNVSLDIFNNEVVCLVGESGCGKTTLGKVIIGLLKPTKGHVLYKNKDLWNLPKHEWKIARRNLQIIHQNPYDAVNPTKKIFDILALPLKEYKIIENKNQLKEKVYQLLENVGLHPEIADKYPHQLSGGQLQRVVIARAVSVNPELIVADEPVSMIDVSLRIDILDLLLDLQKKFNLSSVFITHDLGLARYYGKNGRIVVMYIGSIVEIGPVEHVLSNPLHPYTNALVSVVPLPDPKLMKERRNIPIRSIDIATAINPPSGCKFHPRCPYVMDICERVKPELIGLEGKNRWVACHMIARK